MGSTPRIDEKLKEWATERQCEYIDAINKHGGVIKAAKSLGVARELVSRAIARAKLQAAARGYSPDHDMNKTVPAGFKVRGVSTYYDESGKPRGQWLKSVVDESQREQMLQDFAATLADSVKGLAKPVKAPATTLRDDLLCVIPIGDPHFGLKVWSQEGAANFDLDIAERLTCSALDRLAASAPPARTAILLNLGDHFHADSQSNTTTSGTTVDVDGRWAKIQQVGLRAMLHCIKRLLERHERVVVRINRGNHDKHSSYALSLMISCYFHNEPRVEVDLSPAAVWYFEFGSVLLGSTHGDTIKGDKLVGVMAADRPEQWGRTKHRVWFVGHVHHSDIKEYPGGIVEYMRTLAPGDAWHHGQGYRSGRDMRLVVFHREQGEIERHRCDVGWLT